MTQQATAIAVPTDNPMLNPFPLYAHMRGNSPIFFHPEQNTWLVYGYEDIRTIFNDAATFSSAYMDFDPNSGFEVSMVNMDPPVHTKHRSLISRVFTPKAITDLEPQIERITHDLLDQVTESGRMDLIRDFAVPLPARVIAEMLGVPTEDQEQFKAWGDDIMQMGALLIKGQAVTEELYASNRDYVRYMHDLYDAREAHPQNDLTSALITARAQDEELAARDIVELCKLLLLAGHETTANLVGNAVLTLLEHPEDLARLRANPDLIPTAIEEVLRYRSPVQFLARKATRDVTLSGQEIRAGQRLVFFMGSANHDERVFPEPERFDITRSPNRHLAFGHGIHFCIGAQLARVEARIALKAIFERLPDLRVEEGETIEPVDNALVWGLHHLHLRFTPTPKVLPSR